MIRSINPSEHQIQCAIVEWANTVLSPYVYATTSPIQNKLGDFLLKITNEGKRSWAHAKKMKKEGLKKGVSDMFLPIPMRQQNGTYRAGLWIEIKSKKGILSKEQDEWLTLMCHNGYCSAVVRSVDEGIQAIKDYLGMK